MGKEESENSESSKQERNSKPQERSGERLELESGRVAVVDQFMLANSQLHEARLALIQGGSSATEALSEALSRYGGTSLELTPGTYQVLRDPEDSFIALSLLSADGDEQTGEPEDATEHARELVRSAKSNSKAEAHVYVDTRCLAFVDAALFDDQDLLSKLEELKTSGKDKAARDLVRKRGGAVRYGFNKYGDELGAFRLDAEQMLVLWPDVAE